MIQVSKTYKLVARPKDIWTRRRPCSIFQLTRSRAVIRSPVMMGFPYRLPPYLVSAWSFQLFRILQMAILLDRARPSSLTRSILKGWYKYSYGEDRVQSHRKSFMSCIKSGSDDEVSQLSLKTNSILSAFCHPQIRPSVWTILSNKLTLF